MSSPSQPVCAPVTAIAAQAAVPRKRRRRAPATGAADDCFTCRKKHMKCDRRRPYCSQCLETGKDCSGYKTQLTWGVGVASRGKLRGLSTPVAKQPTSTTKSETVRSRPTVSTQTESDTTRVARTAPMTMVNTDYDDTKPMNVMSHDFVIMDPSGSLPASNMHSPEPDWPSSPTIQEYMEVPNSPAISNYGHSLFRQSLQRLGTPLGSSMDDLSVSVSTSASSISGWSDSDYGSPIDYPQTPDEVYVPAPLPTSAYTMYAQQNLGVSPSQSMMFDRRGPTSCPEQHMARSSISSDQSRYEFLEGNNMSQGQIGPCNLADVFYDDDIPGATASTYDLELGFGCGPSVTALPQRSLRQSILTDASTCPPVSMHRTTNLEHQIPPTPPLPSTISLPSRMRYLIDYYDKVICPVMVAFDGPRNPYRTEVLRMAQESESLRNAISALSSGHLRMRRRQDIALQKYRRRLHQPGLASPLTPTPKSLSSNFNSDVISNNNESMAQAMLLEHFAEESQNQEELDHKRTSIRFLNVQLSHSSTAKADSVLATLFILCLYHTCETGLAQFKTQFAGVKKLLGMRRRSPETGVWGWMETLFTWFDSMTAAVNDREAQLQGGYMDVITATTEEWSLEQLAGCERHLFKIIARLGRLNLMSQKKPVSELPLRLRPQEKIGQSTRDYYSLNYHRVDSNGWVSADESRMEDDDPRLEFWQGWQSTKKGLQEWKFNPALTASIPAGHSTPTTSTEQNDWQHISEAFRYAALLYIERLAHPQFNSSHPTLQSLTAQALYHITSIPVNSAVNKFLLWPLFVTGTECVTESHQSMIRQRCLDIQQESGFFNNISGLDVLEKIWDKDRKNAGKAGESEWLVQDPAAGMGHTTSSERLSSSIGGKGLKWWDIINSTDGEYIMI